MTSLPERIVAIIAPHRCVVCSIEDNIVCVSCVSSLGGDIEPICVVCGCVSRDFKTCEMCMKLFALDYVWLGGAYEGVLERAVRMFKFEGVRAAAEPLAAVVVAQLPVMSVDTVVVPLPTALPRVRRRGYDQAVLLARALARECGLRFATPLARLNDTRQLGASRSERLLQAKRAFYVVKPEMCEGKDVLLVDDVMTTGASLGAAAALLRAAGARSVSAAVVARQNVTDVVQ